MKESKIIQPLFTPKMAPRRKINISAPSMGALFIHSVPPHLAALLLLACDVPVPVPCPSNARLKSLYPGAFSVDQSSNIERCNSRHNNYFSKTWVPMTPPAGVEKKPSRLPSDAIALGDSYANSAPYMQRLARRKQSILSNPLRKP